MADIRELFAKAGGEMKNGNVDLAIEIYDEILRVASPNSEAIHLAHWGIGDIHLNRKELTDAEFHFRCAIQLNPENADYHYLLGCCLTYAERIEEAIESLETALEFKPDNDVILGQLGWVVGHNVDVDQGIAFCKRALVANPSNSSALRDLCMLYARQMKFGEALVCIEEAEKHNPADPLIDEVRREIEFFRSSYEGLKPE
jgi:tetratricopeptide (TPR) repeat protein